VGGDGFRSGFGASGRPRGAQFFEIFEASGSVLEVISGAHASFFRPLRPSLDLLEASWKLFGTFWERLGDTVVAHGHFVQLFDQFGRQV